MTFPFTAVQHFATSPLSEDMHAVLGPGTCLTAGLSADTHHP